MISRKAGSAGVFWAVLPLLALLALGCGDDPATPVPGSVVVVVADRSLNEPVEGVEVRLSPAGLVATTGADGIARFDVAPGDYFVDAQVCCLGPGFIRYHEPVTVTAQQSAEITLDACLRCF